jgi:hypothetical protein
MVARKREMLFRRSNMSQVREYVRIGLDTFFVKDKTNKKSSFFILLVQTKGHIFKYSIMVNYISLFLYLHERDQRNDFRYLPVQK